MKSICNRILSLLIAAAMTASFLFAVSPVSAAAVSGWEFLNSGNQKLTCELDEEIKHSGNASLRISYEAESGPDVYCQIGQRIAVKPNTSYTYSMWIKGEKIGSAKTMINWGTRYHHETFGKTFDWRYAEFEWFSGDATEATFQLVIDETTKNLWLDDVTFVEKGKDVNLLQNPGFEADVAAAAKPEGETEAIQTDEQTGVTALETASEKFVNARYFPVFKAENRKIDGSLEDWEALHFIAAKNDTISAKCSAGYDDENLYLAVETDDDVRNTLATGTGIWQYDSIQFVVGSASEAYGKEVSVSFDEDGPLYFYSEQWHESDYQRIGSMGKHQNGKTVYEISIPWALFDVQPSEQEILFNVLVNDNDGAGRTFLEFASGIATTKTNADFFAMDLIPDSSRLICAIGAPAEIASDTQTPLSFYAVNYNDTPAEANVVLANGETAAITVPAESVYTHCYTDVFRELGDSQITAKVTQAGEDTEVVRNISVKRSDDRILADIAKVRDEMVPELEGLIKQCNDKEIATPYESANCANIKFFVDMAEKDYQNDVKFRADYNLDCLFTLYEEAKSSLEGYLNGTKEEETAYTYLTSDCDVEGQTMWADMLNTKTGQVERRPVFQTGFNCFTDPSAMDDIASMGFNSISLDVGIDEMIIAPDINYYGWTPLNSKPDITLDVVYEDDSKTNSVLKIGSKSEAAANQYLQFYQSYTVEPNTTYEFGLRAKTTNANQLWVSLGGWNTERHYLPAETDGWQSFDFEYTTTEDQTLFDFFINLEGLCDEALIDDVYVREKSGGDNLLVNGDFETGIGVEEYKGMKFISSRAEELKQVLQEANEKNMTVSLNIAIHYWPWFTIEGYENATIAGNFTGNLNYSHDRVREVTDYFLQNFLPYIKDEPALHSVILGNEPGYGTLNNAAFYEPLFRQYLRELYNDDISRLNETYGSDYASFDEVTFEEVKQGDQQNWLTFGIDLSKYEPTPIFYDWVNFNNDTYYDWAAFLYNTVKRYAPEVKTSIKQLASTWRYDHDYFRQFIRNGVEPEHIAQVTDFNGCDAQGNLNNEEQSLSTKMRWYDYLTSIDNVAVFNSEDHVFPDDSDNIHPHIATWCGATVWQSAIHGCPTKVTWNWYTTWPKGSGLYGSMMVRPDATAAQAKATLDLNRLGFEVKALTDAKAEVAVLDSLSSHALDRIFENVSYNAWQSSCYSGQRTDFVTEKQAAEGKLSQYKIVLLPKCDRVKKSTLDALNTYVNNGGRVILFGEDSLLYDEYGNPHDAADYETIRSSAKIVPIQWEGLSMTSPTNKEIRDMLWSEFESLGMNTVRLVDARTNETVYDVEWECVDYNGDLLININNYDWNDTKEIYIEVNGKKADTFTELRSKSDMAGAMTVNPYQPVLVRVPGAGGDAGTGSGSGSGGNGHTGSGGTGSTSSNSTGLNTQLDSARAEIVDQDGNRVDGFDISHDGEGTMTVTLPETHLLDGGNRYTITVTDKSGNTGANVCVILRDIHQNEACGTTGADGMLVLPAQEYASYIEGYPDGTFLPDGNMTRAEAAAIFARLIANKNGEEIPEAAANFQDVDTESWYARYIAYLEKYNILQGYEDNTFRPDQPVSRAEFVTMTVRCYGLSEAVAYPASPAAYADVADTHWAIRDISFAQARGWLIGYEDGTFRAENDITRAEVVAVINRATGRKADVGYVHTYLPLLQQFTDLESQSHWGYYDIMEAANGHKAIFRPDEK